MNLFLAPNMCLHSSIGRALHWYLTVVTDLNPIEALKFFSGFFSGLYWWVHCEDFDISCFSPLCKIISFILSYLSNVRM